MKSHRTIKVSLPAIALTLALVTGALPASAAPVWNMVQLDNDRCWDAAFTDVNANGLMENIWFDLDNDCAWDTHFWNSLGSETLMEELTFDMNENGFNDRWFRDTDQRVGYELVYSNYYPEDGVWDSTNPAPTIGYVGGPSRPNDLLSLGYALAGLTGRAY